jgi:fused signal recognition particle receptor
MSFFKKLKDKLFKSSKKLDEGLDAIVEDGGVAEEFEVDVPDTGAADAEAARVAEEAEAQAAEAARLAEEEAQRLADEAKAAQAEKERLATEAAERAQAEARAAEEQAARDSEEAQRKAEEDAARAAEEARREAEEEAARLQEVALAKAQAEAEAAEAEAAKRAQEAAQAEQDARAEAERAQAAADTEAARVAAEAEAEAAKEAARLKAEAEARALEAEQQAAAQAAEAERRAAEEAAAQEAEREALEAKQAAEAEAERIANEAREAEAQAAREAQEQAAEAQTRADEAAKAAEEQAEAAQDALREAKANVASALDAPAAAALLAGEEEETSEPAKKPGFFGRMLGRKEKKTVIRRELDDDMLEALEELLISADMGVNTALRVTANMAEGRMGKKLSTGEIKELLAAEITAIMEPVAKPMPLYPKRPQVVLVVGVNGSGKTTTIGKLALQFQNAGKKVVIAAGDTFRAAAVEQLQVWGDRAGVPVLTAPEGSDPASLAYDAMTQAEADGADLLMIDTAGRLQNRADLMEELAKIVRVIRKKDETAPHNTLLVLDATTGQNALNQVDVFQQISDVSGLVMTKLDGTAKGGVLVALADKFGLPIHAIGVGEQIDDLDAFDPEDFAKALTGIAD